MSLGKTNLSATGLLVKEGATALMLGTGTRIAGNVQPEVKAKLTLDGGSVIGGETRRSF
ncbi:hypothetical protein D3C79_1060720 [compost metagenome]